MYCPLIASLQMFFFFLEYETETDFYKYRVDTIFFVGWSFLLQKPIEIKR